jgi:hypothetical protein
MRVYYKDTKNVTGVCKGIVNCEYRASSMIHRKQNLFSPMRLAPTFFLQAKKVGKKARGCLIFVVNPSFILLFSSLGHPEQKISF